MPADPVVAGYLAAVADDLDAARRLAAPPANRLAAYHLQQAAEKLVKAVLVHRKIHPGQILFEVMLRRRSDRHSGALPASDDTNENTRQRFPPRSTETGTPAAEPAKPWTAASQNAWAGR